MLPNPQETVDLVKFTEEILNGKLHFLCSAVTFLFRKKIEKDSSPCKIPQNHFSLETVFKFRF